MRQGRRVFDRLAQVVITMGGIAVILSIIGPFLSSTVAAPLADHLELFSQANSGLTIVLKWRESLVGSGGL